MEMNIPTTTNRTNTMAEAKQMISKVWSSSHKLFALKYLKSNVYIFVSDKTKFRASLKVKPCSCCFMVLTRNT